MMDMALSPGGGMHNHITIEVGIDEDSSTTLVHLALDLRGDHFDATGRSKRNPSDPSIPVIGEELALARALGSLEEQLVDRAYARIDGAFLRV
jgi:hypothetical protein